MKALANIKIWPFILLVLLCFNIPATYAKNLVVGLLLAGASNDSSYNQFHLDAARKAAEKVPDIKIIYIDRANPIERRGVTIPAMVDDLVQKGATVIIANTYEMELGIMAVAPKYPQVKFIQISGDDTLVKAALPNITNVSLVFENAQMLSGFAAGMATNSGKVAYLGTSPGHDSHRQIAAAYLGAKYAWEQVRGMQPKDFQFRVKWMGNWFNRLAAEDTRTGALKLFESGSDVVIGGNYDLDAFTAAQELYDANKKRYVALAANPYIPQNTHPCVLGISYYNWLAIYEDLFEKARKDALEPIWLRYMPDMFELNRFGYSNVGFVPYDGLNWQGKIALEDFMWALATGELNLFKGPLFFKDGSVFVEEGQIPDDDNLRNMGQLLSGIDELPYAVEGKKDKKEKQNAAKD